MKSIVQDAGNPSQMLFAFDELADRTVNELRWAVAYTTKGGTEKVVGRILAKVGLTRWNNARKSIITCFDFGITSPAAIRYLTDELGVDVFIANSNVLTSPRLTPQAAFHPKLYMCRGSSVAALIGSANLTTSAMTCNTEVGVLYPNAPIDLWDTGWQTLLDASVAITPALLSEYTRVRTRAPVPPLDLDEVPPALQVNVRGLEVFWDAVSAGRVVPDTFSQFWVEAGSMSSGGSGNQLELPRGANRYFGYAFNNYNDNHALIGNPPLTLFTRTWTDRPLTWHGNNRMERINLPTHAQSGLAYARTAILFRRHAAGFEIAVAPWNDAIAISWRNASATRNLTYRLGATSNRICGLF